MMFIFRFYFPGTPKAIQSFKFTRQGFRYQPADVKNWKTQIYILALQQFMEKGKQEHLELNQNADLAFAVKCYFVFEPPKSWSKKKLEMLRQGCFMPKTTKPDLGDNLMKGLIDALKGVVWKDDSQICRITSEKCYGMDAHIVLEVSLIGEELPFQPKIGG